MIYKNKQDQMNYMQYRLSKNQQSIWAYNKIMPNSSVHNIQYSTRLKEILDSSILKRAAKILIQRHAILGTVYSEVDSGSIRGIQNTTSETFYFEEKDVRYMNAIELQKYLNKKCNEPFNLETGPIIKIYLLKLSNNECIISFIVHHIASDFVTQGIILKEFFEICSRLKKGDNVSFPQTHQCYFDFVDKEYRNKSITGMRDYWLEQLSGDLPYINLLTDKPRSKLTTQEGRIVQIDISRELSEKIKKMAITYNTTTYRLFMTVYYIMLYRYTRQKDIIIGSPASLRKHYGFYDTAGYFVNMLPYRCSFENNYTFHELLANVDDIILNGLKNVEYPFKDITNNIRSNCEITQSPIFQTTLTMQKTYSMFPEGTLNFYLGGKNCTLKAGDIELNSIERFACPSEYELSLYAEESNEGINAKFVYQTELFNHSTIEQMARHFVNIITEVLEDPNKDINHYAIISSREKMQLSSSWNETVTIYKKKDCIHERIEEQALVNPERTAVSFGGITVSYLKLNQKANQLAHFLRKHGVKQGVMVPICLQPSIEMIICIVGILKAGGIYVPINPVYPKDRIQTILEEVEPVVIISESQLSDQISDVSTKKILVDQDWDKLNDESFENSSNIISPDDIAYVIYTSGSTGKPKGVMVSHYNVMRLFEATDHWYKFNKDDVWTLFHSFAFDFSVWEIFGAIMYGGKLIIVPYMTTRSPEAFYKLLSKEKVTVLNQTPSAFRQLIRVDERLHSTYKLSLRFVIFGGESLDLKILEPWVERHGDVDPKLINMYGITETTVHVTYREITLTDIRNATGSVIGVPIPDLKVYILDENRKFIPNGCMGEIYVGGAGITKGYFKREELTQEKFVTDFIGQSETDKLYRSGDLGRYLQNGDIEYLGRLDQQVKIRGFRIELGDIEAKIFEFPGIAEVIVIVREDIAYDKRLIAYFVTKINDHVKIGELRKYVGDKLPDYMVPSAFVKMDCLPITPNGKVDRKALPIPVSEEALFIPPETALEKSIVNIWKSILNIESVGLTSNFFDLGGNSFLILEVHSIMKDQVYNQLEVIDLFRYPTIRSLAEFIKSNSDFNHYKSNINKGWSRAEARRNARLKRNVEKYEEV